MKTETLLYIIAGIAWVLYNYYRKAQKNKQRKEEPETYDEPAYDDETDVFSFNELIKEESKQKEGSGEYEQYAESDVLAEEVIEEKTSDFHPEPLVSNRDTKKKVEEKPREFIIDENYDPEITESMSEIVSRMKEQESKEKKKEKEEEKVEEVETIVEEEPFGTIDMRQAFIHSEIFKRKYE